MADVQVINSAMIKNRCRSCFIILRLTKFVLLLSLIAVKDCIGSIKYIAYYIAPYSAKLQNLLKFTNLITKNI